MPKIEKIVIHHSASNWGSVGDIRKWHLDRGWRDIGYSVVILNGQIKPEIYIDKYNGRLEMGRGLNFDNTIDGAEIGAHTLGYNTKSIGVCMVGNGDFTGEQWKTLKMFIQLWQRIIPDVEIVGHREVGSTTCPGFDVQKWLIEEGLK